MNLSFAFSKDRCGQLFPTFDGDHPPYYSPLYVSTMIPSTTSYFSSFGPCAMYGQTKLAQRETFVEYTYAALQSDAARGQGDYLNALMQMTGCPRKHREAFNNVIHSNYEVLFHPTGRPQPSDFVRKMDLALSKNPELSKSCSLVAENR